MDKLMTLEEVADVLRTPIATLRYWRHQGTGPASLKVGRRVMFRPADVQAYVDTLAGAA